VPKLIEDEEYHKCMKKPAGMKGMDGKWGKKGMKQEMGGGGSHEEEEAAGARKGNKRGGMQGGQGERKKWGGDNEDEGRPQGEVATGEGQADAMVAPQNGRFRNKQKNVLIRSKREPHGDGRCK
jgi:hypothetical protein